MTDGASAPPPSPPGSGSSPAATGQSSPARTGQTQPGQAQPGQPQSGQAQSAQAQPGQAGSAPSSPPPATSTAQAQQSLPADLARAPAGTVIEAEAVSRNADGSVTLRTAQGDIRADLTRAQVAELLRAGTRATIELRNPTAQPPQLVVTVRGAPGQGATQAGAAAQPAVSTAASGPAPTVPLTVGRILQAVTVPGPSAVQPSAPAAVPGAIPAGTPAGTPAATPAASPAAPPAGPLAAPPAASPAAPPAGPLAAAPAPSAQAPVAQATAPAGSQAAAPTPQGAPPSQGNPAASPGAAQAAPGAAPPPGPSVPAQPSVSSALAAQSAYRHALGLTGRAVQAPAPQAPGLGQIATPVSTAAPAGQPAAAPAGAGLAAATPAPDASGGGRLPTGAIVTVRVLATGEEAARYVGARDTAPAPQQAGPGGATVLSGTVAGVTQSGRPVIATPFGHLALNATSDLRLGDRVALDVLASRVGDMPTAERAAPLSVLAREWPALDGAMRALQDALGPQAAAQITQAMVRPSPQLTAAMLFFMSALKGGDMRSWFGQDASRALEQAGRGGLLSALAEDFQTLQRAAEPMDNGWRAFLIPVVGAEKRPIRLLTRGRRRGGGKDGDGAPDGTAFLVDLELTALGPFRLDGLVRGDLIDLWIRTTKPLPGLMRHDIKALFDDTLDRTGIQGRLAFKATPVLPPLPVADLEAGSAGDTESLFA